VVPGKKVLLIMEIHVKRFESFFKPAAWFTPLLLAASMAGCGGDGDGLGFNPAVVPPTDAGAGTGVDGLGQGPAPVDLLSAGSFVILAEAAVTNIPTSAVTGDVGLSPASGSFNGLACTDMAGTSQIHAVDAAGPAPTCTVIDPSILTVAVTDKGTAFTDAQGRAPDYTELGDGDIGGLNLGPATYKWGTGVMIPTDVTLTGGPNDVWIFQIAQGLSVSSGVHVILAGGAQAKNIFWATFAAADLGTTSHFEGVILSSTSVVMKTGASINGRLYAGTAVTLAQNAVTQP
jgi:hypothetical protein